MASKVKVNVKRETLIETLQQRLEEIESGKRSAYQLTNTEAEAISLAETMIEELRSGKGYARHTYDALTNAYQEVYYEKAEGRKSGGNLVDRIRGQIKMLEMSDDETVQVGINDELYELLV